jgi:hypothetical protein
MSRVDVTNSITHFTHKHLIMMIYEVNYGFKNEHQTRHVLIKEVG